MSAPDPREAWQRIQTELTRRTARFGGGGGGPPKGAFGGLGALFVIGGGVYLANNALFNGSLFHSELQNAAGAYIQDGAMLTKLQWTEVTEQSSTPG